MTSMQELFYGDGESTWIIPGYPHQEEVPRVYHTKEPYMYYRDEDAPIYRARYQRSQPHFQSPTRRFYQDVPPYTETRYKAPVAATRHGPSVVELIVPMCCIKCEEKVKESLLEMEGVEQVKTNQYNHRVTVTGFVDPVHVLKRAKKIKKRADFMPWMPYQHSPYESAKSYSQYPQSSRVHMNQQYYPDNSKAYTRDFNYPHNFYAPSYHRHYWQEPSFVDQRYA